MNKSEREKIIVISIMTYYAKQIFDETKLYEFRKLPLRDNDVSKKYIFIQQKKIKI